MVYVCGLGGCGWLGLFPDLLRLYAWGSNDLLYPCAKSTELGVLGDEETAPHKDYVTIGEAAAADPELGQRILLLMEEHASAGG